MAWWNFRKNSVMSNRTVEVKSALGSDGNKFLLFGASHGADTPRAAMKLFEESSAVYIPVTRLAEAISNLHPVLVIDEKKVLSHPFLDYIKNPCDWMSYKLLMKSSAIYYLVTGETFFLGVGGVNRPPLELYSVNPALVKHNIRGDTIDQLEIIGNFYPSAYKYDVKRKTFYSGENLKELHHLRDFSPNDNSVWRGRSRLISASNAARQQLLGMKHNVAMLENGGRLSLIFHFENAMDEEQFQAVKQRVIEQYSGADKAGTIGVTAGGKLQIEQAGLTPQDMDWSNAQRAATQVLLLVYGLPLPLFSLDASTFNNMSSAMEMFYDDAVLPNAQIIFDGLAKMLFPRFKIDPSVRLTYDPDRITALTTRRNNEVKLRKDIGIETDNELRGILGREPYVGGDVMYKPSALIPIGTDILTEDDDITDVEAGTNSAE